MALDRLAMAPPIEFLQAMRFQYPEMIHVQRQAFH